MLRQLALPGGGMVKILYAWSYDYVRSTSTVVRSTSTIMQLYLLDRHKSSGKGGGQISAGTMETNAALLLKNDSQLWNVLGSIGIIKCFVPLFLTVLHFLLD